ncbi:MAG: transposase, partial [Methanobrevibacter sp.]|nr:transposase [Candidatus Methanovirga basalitermitum]
MDSIFQSRKLSKAIQRDAAYIYLTRHQTIDYSTISRFKNNYKDLIEEIFKTTIELAKEAGMFNL